MRELYSDKKSIHQEDIIQSVYVSKNRDENMRSKMDKIERRIQYPELFMET